MMLLCVNSKHAYHSVQASSSQ